MYNNINDVQLFYDYGSGLYPEDNSKLAELARDFRCKRADDMQLQELAERVRFFKETEEGVSQVCEAIEKIRNEAVLLDKYEIALSLIEDGTFSHEKIAALTGLSLEDVEELAKQKSVNAYSLNEAQIAVCSARLRKPRNPCTIGGY